MSKGQIALRRTTNRQHTIAKSVLPEMCKMEEAQDQLDSCEVSFSGDVIGGIELQGDLILYPVGSAVVAKSTTTMDTLRFGDAKVSCLAVSKDGKNLAAGKITSMGLEAELCIWDLASKKLTQRCLLHKGRIQALSFSPCASLLASIGGPDDNSLVIWEVGTGKALCGSPMSASAVAFFNRDSERLATCGIDSSMHIWQLDRAARKMTAISVQLGLCRRNFTILDISEDDRYLYVGSTSGDVAEVSTEHKRLCRSGPARKGALSTVSALRCLPGGILLVGGGEGRLIAIDTAQSEQQQQAAGRGPLSIMAEARLPDGVTSIAVHPSSGEVVVGTRKSDMFGVTLDRQANKLIQQLRHTAHCSAVNDVEFPHGSSDLIASCSHEEIRVWNITSRTELLRIRLPGLDCLCLAITQDGKSIIVGCSDGTIRAHAPQTGSQQYIIHDAHHTAVLALEVTSNGITLISGDNQGYLRVWRIGAGSQTLLMSLKEHKGAINRISVGRLHPQDCVTASSDGSCIIWDLTTLKRKCMMSANAFFKDAAWSSDESQLVTAGTDRKLVFWDCYTGESIRELEGSRTEPMLSAAVHPAGSILASGGADHLVRLWRYDEGVCFAVGYGHTGEVRRCVFSPDGKMLVTADSHGALKLWDVSKL